MKQIIGKDFLAAWSLFNEACKLAEGNRQRKATKEERDLLLKALNWMHYQSRQLGMRQSSDLCNRLHGQLADPACHRTWSPDLTKPGYTMPKEPPLPPFESVYWQLQGIADEFKNEMDSIRLTVVCPDKVQFFERDDLFGKAVKDAASLQLNDEIKAAGNCLAADLHNAAAFHLLCAANLGLIALSRDLRVIIKKTPLEFAEWQAMTSKLEGKLRQKNIKPRGNRQQQARTREFYTAILSELPHLKELRNEVMHARAKYEKPSILALLDRVRAFMQKLATQVALK